MLKKVSATMAVIYPPERKLAKRISVQCLIKKEAIICAIFLLEFLVGTVKLGDKEHIGVTEPFPVTKCQFKS